MHHVLMSSALLAMVPIAANAQWCPARGPEETPQGATAIATLVRMDEPGERMAVTGIVRRMDGRRIKSISIDQFDNLRGRYPK